MILTQYDGTVLDTAAAAPHRRFFAIGDVIMANSGGVVDPDGVRWIVDNLDGWESVPGTTNEVTQRAGDHGGWISPAYLTPRTITVTGSIGADWATANRAMDRLTAAVPISDLAPAYFAGAGPDMQALVRQGDELLHKGTATATSFSLSLLAPDPRRYSAALLTSEQVGLPVSTGGLRIPARLPLRVTADVATGELNVENAGNMDAPVMLTVVGPCPPFTIDHAQTGRHLRYHEQIPAGHSLIIDTDARTSLLDGTAPRAITGSWFFLTPGLNTFRFSGDPQPSARLSVAYRHAWK